MPSLGPDKNPQVPFHKQWWFWYALAIIVVVGLLQIAAKYGMLAR